MPSTRPPRKRKNGALRKITERLGAEKTIVTESGNAGLARLLLALRTAAAANKNNPFDYVFGRKPNTIEKLSQKNRKTL